jgi:SAM-dependent methyltransferase
VSVTEVRFDKDVAASYDESSPAMNRPEVLDPAVDFLAGLAGKGAALEFGVGTGRVALPLSSRGIPVHGIDVSQPMLDQLRSKPGADQISVTVGDFAKTRVNRTFRVAYLVFNTITNLTTQEEQVACFQNAAEHLEASGCFVIEVFVPQLRRLPPGERVRAFEVRPSHLGFDEYTDFAAQILHSHHYWIRGGKLQQFSAPFRYVWPAELDLMARLAGMTLRERWAGWSREPFTDESTSHVSVWQKPER